MPMSDLDGEDERVNRILSWGEVALILLIAVVCVWALGCHFDA